MPLRFQLGITHRLINRWVIRNPPVRALSPAPWVGTTAASVFPIRYTRRSRRACLCLRFRFFAELPSRNSVCSMVRVGIMVFGRWIGVRFLLSLVGLLICFDKLMSLTCKCFLLWSIFEFELLNFDDWSSNFDCLDLVKLVKLFWKCSFDLFLLL